MPRIYEAPNLKELEEIQSQFNPRGNGTMLSESEEDVNTQEEEKSSDTMD